MTAEGDVAARKAVEAVWRIESARLLGGLVRVVRDVGLAEDLAQAALVTALERWPATGIPENPGAWLMAAARHRAIDELRHRQTRERKREEVRSEISRAPLTGLDLEREVDEHVGDDLLRLMLIACHPVLSTEGRVALTLRLLGGLSTDEIARAFLVSEPTSVRGDLLAKLGRTEDARREFTRAAALAENVRERSLLLARAAACGGSEAS